MPVASKPAGTALVRRPSPRIGEGIVTYLDRRPVDPDRAFGQWRGYVAALETAGWKAVELEPADESPDGVFVEDTLVVCDGLAVVTRPGAVERRRETASAERAAARLGMELARIDEPGTLDGGDVLRSGTAVYVGVGGRSNSGGAAQLGSLLEPRGLTVVSVPLSGVLHLKSAAGRLPDGSLVGFGPLLGATGLPTLRAVPEPSGAQVVALDDHTVLLADDCPRSAAAYRELGYETVCVAIGEFQKREGAVTCLSVLVDQPLR
jgi:dimethylargininase